jgi:Arc/MetJ-type ribon-helix-helix transcriptional regulator
MSKQRLSVSVDAALLRAAEEAVERGRAPTLSAWVNEALRLELERDRKLEALSEFVAAYEAEHGVISPEELARSVRASVASSRAARSPTPRRRRSAGTRR